MKAVKTPESNLTLELPGAKGERDLPAQVIKAFDPGLGETEDDARDAILTVWNPDDGERRALVNGAQIELVVTGTGHPPVSLNVGAPMGELTALISKAHADRAIGFLYSKLAEALAGDGMPDAKTVVEWWSEALEETKEGLPADFGEKLDQLRDEIQESGPESNGDGPE